MKALVVLLGGLLVAAPAAAVCACAEPAPKKASMGCEGTAGCCCGDPADPGPQDPCPRAEKSVDAAELPEDAADQAAAALPSSPFPVSTPDAGPAASTSDDSSPAPPRPRRSRPLLL